MEHVRSLPSSSTKASWPQTSLCWTCALHTVHRYVIPPAHRARFETMVKGLLPDMFKQCPEFLRHKVGCPSRGSGLGSASLYFKRMCIRMAPLRSANGSCVKWKTPRVGCLHAADRELRLLALLVFVIWCMSTVLCAFGQALVVTCTARILHVFDMCTAHVLLRSCSSHPSCWTSTRSRTCAWCSTRASSSSRTLVRVTESFAGFTCAFGP